MGRKIHFPASKRDAFHLEKQALLRARLEVEFDLASSPDNPPPRKRMWRAGVKKLRHYAVIARVARGRGNLSVCGDTALWDRADHATKRRVSNLVRPGNFLCDPPDAFPRERGSCLRFHSRARTRGAGLA